MSACPLETARLVQLQRLLGDRVGRDIFFYSITIDPKRDTPAVLKAYAEKFGVGPGRLLLTGKDADIKLVSRKLGLSRRSDVANRDGHMPILMVGTFMGRTRGRAGATRRRRSFGRPGRIWRV